MTAMRSNAPRMPSVIGMNLAQAQAVISTAIADPQVTIQHSDPGKMPPGMVIGQRPAAGVDRAPAWCRAASIASPSVTSAKRNPDLPTETFMCPGSRG